MNQSKAIIVLENREALRVAASAARISTQQGTAMEMFEDSNGDERDLKLIGKVLSSVVSLEVSLGGDPKGLGVLWKEHQ